MENLTSLWRKSSLNTSWNWPHTCMYASLNIIIIILHVLVALYILLQQNTTCKTYVRFTESKSRWIKYQHSISCPNCANISDPVISPEDSTNWNTCWTSYVSSHVNPELTATDECMRVQMCVVNKLSLTPASALHHHLTCCCTGNTVLCKLVVHEISSGSW
jgi:hypothetical protein